MTEVNTINQAGPGLRRVVVGVLGRVPEGLACGFLTSVMANVFGVVAGAATCVVVVAGWFAAPRVGDWLFWRRFAPPAVAAPVVARVEVDLDAESARVVDAVAEARDITPAEVLRRGIVLLGDFEGVAPPPAGMDVDPVPVSASEVCNYVQLAEARMRTALPGLDADLVRLCTLLALVTGTDTTAADVHDAWSVWRSAGDPRHPSLVPFGQLGAEVQALDAPFVDAIRLVAASLEGGRR